MPLVFIKADPWLSSAEQQLPGQRFEGCPSNKAELRYLSADSIANSHSLNHRIEE
jgi:hypothetical protein